MAPLHAADAPRWTRRLAAGGLWLWLASGLALPGCYAPQLGLLRSGLDSLRAVVDTMSVRDSVTRVVLESTRRELADQREILLSTRASTGSTSQEVSEQMTRLGSKLDEVMGRFQQIQRTSPSTPSGGEMSQLYDQAAADLTQGRYASALKQFREFVKRYPSTDLTDNAQYGVGRASSPRPCSTAPRWNTRGWKPLSPNGDKVPAALYKLGLSRERQKKAAAAKANAPGLGEALPQLRGSAARARAAGKRAETLIRRRRAVRRRLGSPRRSSRARPPWRRLRGRPRRVGIRGGFRGERMSEALRERAPVVVVGAGCIGAAIAYHLSRLGVRGVTILEREPFAGAGSTGRAAGGIRAHFSTPISVRISQLAISHFERFSEEMQADPVFFQVGYLFLLAEESRWRAFQEQAEMQRGLGLPVQTLSPREAQEIVPQLVVEDLLGATYCPKDGLGNPHEVTQAYVSRARALGARFEFQRTVTGLRLERNAVVGVRDGQSDRSTRRRW